MNSPNNYQSPHLSNPRDRVGHVISAFDLVRIVKMPWWYSNDTDEEVAMQSLTYIGSYGMIKYNISIPDNGDRFWFGNNKLFMVEAIKISNNCIEKFDFTMNEDCVDRIPFNIFILSLFSYFDWDHLLDVNPDVLEIFTNGRGSPKKRTESIFSKESEAFGYLKNIIHTPYESLVNAHNLVSPIFGKNNGN